MPKKELTYGDVWKTLSAVNVNEHTQKKNNLTYLSWAWAWGVMMEHYPDMEIEWIHEDGKVPSGVAYHTGGTASVYCRVRIGSLSRECWLPVMDYRNKAIANPDARAINDAKMRCMVKCFALFGLGHYIYAGEDLPGEQHGNDEFAEVNSVIKEMKDLSKALASAHITVPTELQDECNVAYKNKDIPAMKAAISHLKMLDAGGEDA